MKNILFIAVGLLPYSLGFADYSDLAGSYHCVLKSKMAKKTTEFTLFVKKTSDPKVYQTMYEGPNTGKFKGTVTATQIPNYYFSKWAKESDPNFSGIARWKVQPDKDGTIKTSYLGMDQQNQLILEGKVKCTPIYD